MKSHTFSTATQSRDPERSESSANRMIRGVEGRLRSCAKLQGYVTRVSKLVLAALEEIFDESAYARFLSRNDLKASSANYAAFRDEHDASQARKPRCC